LICGVDQNGPVNALPSVFSFLNVVQRYRAIELSNVLLFREIVQRSRVIVLLSATVTRFLVSLYCLVA